MCLVEFPDGTKIRPAGIDDRRVHDDWRDFGLYLDKGWSPSWPHEMIAWQDFGTPEDCECAAKKIRAAFDRAKAGEHIEVGCRGGMGRTGTVLACMAFLAGVDAKLAVAWVRENYCFKAVETEAQEAWVLWFARESGKV